MSCLNTFTFSSSTANTLTVDTSTSNVLTFESAVHNDMTFDTCAVQTAFFAYSASGALGVSGACAVRQGFNFVPSGRLGVSGLATTAQGSAWQLIDTFTGADGTAINGSTCDTGQTRIGTLNSGNAILFGNTGAASGNITGWRYTQLATAPTQIKWTTADGGDHGVQTSLFFYFDLGSNYFFIRVNGGTITLFKNGSPVSWTTGTSTGGYGNNISLTADLTTDLITLTVDDSSLGHQVLTYSEVGMPNQTNKYIQVFTTNFIDNIYIK